MSELPGLHTTLEFYRWIIVRFRCAKCRRHGDARLAKLAEKFGATETIESLLTRFHATCPNRRLLLAICRRATISARPR